jgi:hypothetical protein
MSRLQLRKLHAMGGQIQRGSYHNAKGNAFTCQKCGSQSDSLDWFIAHKKTHPNFNNEPHYQINNNRPASAKLRHHDELYHGDFCKKHGCYKR